MEMRFVLTWSRVTSQAAIAINATRIGCQDIIAKRPVGQHPFQSGAINARPGK
jgi:hypothetical protein